MFKRRIIGAVGLTLCLFLAPNTVAQDLDLSWNTIDGGGEMFSTGGTLELGGTIGQTDANAATLTGGTLELEGGFWPGVVCYLTGDVDCDGDVDLADLAALLGAYGACTGDPDYNPDADFDDNGCIELSDLATLLGNYGCGT